VPHGIHQEVVGDVDLVAGGRDSHDPCLVLDVGSGADQDPGFRMQHLCQWDGHALAGSGGEPVQADSFDEGGSRGHHGELDVSAFVVGQRAEEWVGRDHAGVPSGDDHHADAFPQSFGGFMLSSCRPLLIDATTQQVAL
jgi:hypothetical protein